MYKLISYYRSASTYPASARIIQVTSSLYILFIQHDTVGTVRYRKGCLSSLKKGVIFLYPLWVFPPDILEEGEK